MMGDHPWLGLQPFLESFIVRGQFIEFRLDAVTQGSVERVQ
jgi:hypothetical protein